MKKSTIEIEVSHDAMLRIPAESLYALFGTDQAQANQLSPIFSMKEPKQSSKSEELDEITNHASFNMVKTLLLKPDIRIEHRYGGDSIGLTVFSAFMKREHGSTLVTFPERDGSMLLRLYPSFEEYLHWWTNLLLSRVSNAIANFLPPPLTVPSLIYGMHAIDCYKRYSYRKTLDYEPATTPFIGCKEYNESLSRSISSFDLRWLLSSFFALTPDIEEISFEPETRDLENLVRRTILLPGQGENAENLFFFGEAGQYLGAEFFRSWELSIGLSARRLIEGQVKPFFRAFIAPTALSNHIFQLEMEDKEMSFNHQALTFGNIIRLLEDKLCNLPEITKTTHIKAEPKISDNINLPASKLCVACGESTPASMKFCGNCGNKLDEATGETARRAEVSTKGNQAVQQLTAKEFQALAAKIQQAQKSQRISEKQFKLLHAEFKAKTHDGALWTVGLKSQEWFKNIDGAWQKHKAPVTVMIDKELVDKLQKLN